MQERSSWEGMSSWSLLGLSLEGVGSKHMEGFR